MPLNDLVILMIKNIIWQVFSYFDLKNHAESKEKVAHKYTLKVQYGEKTIFIPLKMKFCLS